MSPAIFLFASVILASAQAPSTPGKPLPPGPMQAKVKAACTQCHAASRITEQHLTRQRWAGQLGKMEGLGAVIADSDRDALLNYLAENFGPEKGAANDAGTKSQIKGSTPSSPPPHWLRKFGAPSGLSYVGSEVCARCHSSIARTQVRTAMGQASALPSESSILLGAPLSYRDGPYLLRIEQKYGKEVYSASDEHETVSAPVLWAFGLGNAGQTYIFERAGTYYESRVSYYNQIEGLDLTTGHPRQPPPTLLEALGRPLSKDEMTKCFGCHTSEDLFNGKLQIDQLRTGVTCENCHGPGSEHFRTNEQRAGVLFSAAKWKPQTVCRINRSRSRRSVGVMGNVRQTSGRDS